MFTRACHWSQSWARCILHSTPFHVVSLSSILTGFPNVVFPLGFPIKILYVSYLFHVCYMIHSSLSLRFDHLNNNVWWSVEVMKLLIV
jgi:hypothetical protein